MELLLVAVIVLIVAGFGCVIFVMNQKLSGLKDDTALGMIKQDLAGMGQMLTTTQQHMNERLDRAATVFGGLQNELGKMQELGRSIKDIQDVLKSPKLRGNIGEQMMSDLISQQIPKQNYQMQHAFRSGEKVDAVIKTKNGLIPIDSKFPAENFIKFTQAENEADKAALQKLFVSDVKKHIQAIGRKYILPSEGTVDFALMYVPGEAIYYEIMMNTDLCDVGSRQRVFLVSPQSFSYFLGTILLSLEGELIEQKAKEVMDYLKGIQVDSRKFGTDLSLVSKHVTNAKRATDDAAVSYEKLSGKIDSANRLTGESARQIEETVANISVGVEE